MFKHFKYADFDSTFITPIGAEESYGANARTNPPREAALWMAVQHQEKKALQLWSMEIASAGTGMYSEVNF